MSMKGLNLQQQYIALPVIYFRFQLRLVDVGMLLGLMCLHACEESEMILYGLLYQNKVELEKGTILNNLDSLTKMVSSYFDTNSDVSFSRTILNNLKKATHLCVDGETYSLKD